MKRIIGMMAAVAMLVGMLAVPASAALVDSGAAVIQGGLAQVGVTAPATCSKNNIGNPSGNGLFLPPSSPGSGAYSLHIPPGMIVAVSPGSPGVLSGELHICGYLDDVAGQGPACGASKGYNGKGKIALKSGGAVVFQANLYDVGWKVALGGVLPIIGKYQEKAVNGDGSKGIKLDKWGQLLSVINARGGTACTTPAGASTFEVDGVAALINTGADKESVPLRWNDIAPKNDPGHPTYPIWNEKEHQKPKGS